MPTVTQARKRLRGMAGEHVALAIWSEADVLETATVMHIECGQSEARHIIDAIDSKQDASAGITWDTIAYHLNELKRTREEEKPDVYREKSE